MAPREKRKRSVLHGRRALGDRCENNGRNNYCRRRGLVCIGATIGWPSAAEGRKEGRTETARRRRWPVTRAGPDVPWLLPSSTGCARALPWKGQTLVYCCIYCSRTSPAAVASPPSSRREYIVLFISRRRRCATGERVYLFFPTSASSTGTRRRDDDDARIVSVFVCVFVPPVSFRSPSRSRCARRRSAVCCDTWRTWPYYQQDHVADRNTSARTNSADNAYTPK